MDGLPQAHAHKSNRTHNKKIIYVVRGRPGKDDRGALPAGHRLTWGMLTDGTVLEDAPYPFPVFGP